ncbi:MAG TPA: hypothetical protein PKD12_15145 [Nitrospira sp.]|nr:hypothetical protein [Nitrospira sp.]
MFYDWKPYVSVAERKRKAEREFAKSKKNGATMTPVVIAGRAIATTFWGKAWCQNIERYSDYANRLPRGRSYVRNRAVLDLHIADGVVKALVMGSRRYQVEITVTAVPQAHWNAVCKDCSDAIDSLVELLQGRFSEHVMERICRPGTGLFPIPKDITFACSCPDWASMCKHVAAVLYGIGARLDEQPQLLFMLRNVDEKDLIAKAGKGLPLSSQSPKTRRVLKDTELADVFGIEMAGITKPLTKQKAARKIRQKSTTKSAKKNAPKARNPRVKA